MFFLGHMAWAYVLAKPFSKNINMYLIMLLGILPDIDILFNSSIEHRSITHSIPILSMLFIPLFVKYRRKALPYYIALTQHVFFGDLIVGKTQLFWPFGPTIGLGFSLTSIENIIIEGIGLGIFIALIIKDRQKLLTRNNLLVLIPLLLLIIFPINYSIYELDHESIDNFSKNIVREDTAFLVSLLHIILAIILTIILLKSSRANRLRGSDFSKYGEK